MLSRTMYAVMVLLPPESVLMSMAYVAIKGHKEAQGSELPPVAMLVSGGCAAVWPTET